jgi:hypothetical protein
MIRISKIGFTAEGAIPEGSSQLEERLEEEDPEGNT